MIPGVKNDVALDFSRIYCQHAQTMSSEVSNQELLLAWKAGNHDAAAQIFRRYQIRLISLVRARLSRKLARRVDAEDILLSAYRSFFVGVRERSLIPTDSDDLWPLLTTIALRKLARHARYHSAECRSIKEESQKDSHFLETLVSHDPPVEHVAILADEIERLMSRLDATAREVLVRALQGSDVNSIAVDLQRNERTVRRAFEKIRLLLPSVRIDSTISSISPLKPMRKTSAEKKSKVTLQGTVKYCDYLLQRMVGAGAFSKVYRAEERSSGKTVAIKYLRKDCWHDPRAAESLIREYEILRQLNHPGILAVHGWGTTRGGSLFLVNDFSDGCTLTTSGSTVRPTIRQILDVLKEIVTSVAAAHSAQIIHGDLKPANILMGTDGKITLCDFGLSRYASDPDDVPRGGTAGFLAPEQLSDAFGSVTQLTDVYGVGGLLYALLTGRSPMTGRDLPEILANVLSQRRPEAPLPSNDSFSARLNELILRCLQKEPQHRFSSIQELSIALAKLTDE